ncbi:MAG TPA: V-type ATPase 116kDa subunit family protein [Clostridia bacterium]|nr:V-type ATPase 116kDa subunit family protein [Clostridia bacterium]
MAIQKMEYLRIVGSLEDMHEVLEKLVLSEKLHFDFEGTTEYDNSYIIHEYESVMTGPSSFEHEDFEAVEAQCDRMEKDLEHLAKGMDIRLELDKSSISGTPCSLSEAQDDLNKLMEQLGQVVSEINRKREAILKYEQFRETLNGITYKDIDFGRVAALNYFAYEIGALSQENVIRLRKNYENISAIALNIGMIKASSEYIDIILYPRQFAEETSKLLKSLNWVRLDIPENLSGTVSEMIGQVNDRIRNLRNEIGEQSKVINTNKAGTISLLSRIYTAVKLERRILGLEREITYGTSTFVLNAWIRKDDKKEIMRVLDPLIQKIKVEEKNPNELGRQVVPPTQLKNNFFFRPFEKVIKLYGMPSYDEIDPTPFVAITFCLMFGIMFGDMGQGFVYFLAGLLISKKRRAIGQLLSRLGASSILFGAAYGSLFGLEQEELPWLWSLTGRPLDPRNIPVILIAGVAFGIAALTSSFTFSIINYIKKSNIEEGIFGKNGLAGYIFLISLVLTIVAVVKAIKLPVAVPLASMVASLAAMVAKEPLSNLVSAKRPLLHGSVGAYLTESLFEGVETVLSTLSNAISFIRVGAFALNHAGLFLAFLVMSDVTSNIVLKIVILLLGNILILTLEGLVVFIQGLRLEYYEMFGKYFQGGGIAFSPAKINN